MPLLCRFGTPTHSSRVMTAETVSIRRATADDAAGVLDCLRLAFEPYRDRYTPLAFADTVLSAETIQRRLTKMVVFVAVDAEGTVAGTVGYEPVGDGEGHLRGMAVLPNRLGGGIAQQLLDTVEREMRQHGCSLVTLDTTEPLTRAIRFYERNGFTPTGIVREVFGMPLVEYIKLL